MRLYGTASPIVQMREAPAVSSVRLLRTNWRKGAGTSVASDRNRRHRSPVPRASRWTNASAMHLASSTIVWKRCLMAADAEEDGNAVPSGLCNPTASYYAAKRGLLLRGALPCSCFLGKNVGSRYLEHGQKLFRLASRLNGYSAHKLLRRNGRPVDSNPTGFSHCL